MTTRRFDPNTQTLLEPITAGDLRFRSIRTGEIYSASPEDTLLAAEEVGEVDILSKYKNTISTTAYDPANPCIRLKAGCPHCHRKIVRFQRLGDSKTVVYACLCGGVSSKSETADHRN